MALKALGSRRRSPEAKKDNHDGDYLQLETTTLVVNFLPSPRVMLPQFIGILCCAASSYGPYGGKKGVVVSPDHQLQQRHSVPAVLRPLGPFDEA